jgi:hypothetical protein
LTAAAIGHINVTSSTVRGRNGKIRESRFTIEPAGPHAVALPHARPAADGHLVIQLWFVLPDGSKVAGQVPQVPRRGDVVRFSSDGQAFEVAQIEHIATPEGNRYGMRYAKIVIRLSVPPMRVEPE